MRRTSLLLLGLFAAFSALDAQTPPPLPGAATSAVELKVTDAEGKPVLAARVTPVLFRGEGQNLGRLPDHAPRSLEATDFASGSAKLEGLPPGRYALAVEAAGHALTVSEGFTLSAEKPVRCQVRLRRGCTLEGRVLTPDGKPLAGALVRSGLPDRLRNENLLFQLFDQQNFAAQTFTSTQTGADGSYRLEHIAPGTYDLVAEHEAFAASKVRVKVGEKATQKVAALSMEHGRVLTGLVRRTGQTVPGAVVVLSVSPAQLKDGATTVQEVIQVYVEVRADDTGVFRFPRLPFGEYKLSAFASENPPERMHQVLKSQRDIIVKADGNAAEQVEDLELPRK
jgi:uncharacterized GH25 family protein